MSDVLLETELNYPKNGFRPEDYELGYPGFQDADLAAGADAAVAYQVLTEAAKRYADRREAAYLKWMDARDLARALSANDGWNRLEELQTAMGYGEPSRYYTEVTDEAVYGPTSEDMLPELNWAMWNWRFEDGGGAHGVR